MIKTAGLCIILVISGFAYLAAIIPSCACGKIPYSIHDDVEERVAEIEHFFNRSSYLRKSNKTFILWGTVPASIVSEGITASATGCQQGYSYDFDVLADNMKDTSGSSAPPIVQFTLKDGLQFMDSSCSTGQNASQVIGLKKQLT